MLELTVTPDLSDSETYERKSAVGIDSDTGDAVVTMVGKAERKMKPDLAGLRRGLREWFARERRELPWRATTDPYAIWISEIMLQQTRVAAVIERYEGFLRRFPTVESLAAAGEAEVLAEWSGLGYYRRARMLHGAARMVCAERGGRVPDGFAALVELPGVGRYTAAAIASIAFGEPVAAVDGNVERVVLRLMGWGSEDAATHRAHLRQAVEMADELLDRAAPGDWNQAMMELGATVCLPRGPRCEVCPWLADCATRGEHPAVKRAAMRTVEMARAWMTRGSRRGEEVMLVERGAAETVMPGMWELPEAPTQQDGEPLLRVRHAIMQVNYRVAVYATDRAPASGCASRWVTLDEAERLPLTGLTRKVMRGMGWLASEKPQAGRSVSRIQAQ